MEKVNFTSSPLIDAFRKTDEEDLPFDEREALLPKYNKTKLFFTDIKFRLLNDKFFIIFITGKGGEGKSTIGKYIVNEVKKFVYQTKQGKEIIEKWAKKDAKKPKYGVDFFCFTDNEFLDVSGKAQPLEVVVKDENYEPMSGIGGKAEKERKRMLLSRIRARQVLFILIDPIFDDSKLNYLYTYRIFANDISYEATKNRGIISIQDYDGCFKPFGHIITDEVEIKGYDEKKNKQLSEIQKMQQPEYKRKQLQKIVKKMVFWNDKNGDRDDIRDYTKNCWNGIIRRRLDEMGLGGLRATTEIKEIKDSIDAYYPTKSQRRIDF